MGSHEDRKKIKNHSRVRKKYSGEVATNVLFQKINLANNDKHPLDHTIINNFFLENFPVRILAYFYSERLWAMNEPQILSEMLYCALRDLEKVAYINLLPQD